MAYSEGVNIFHILESWVKYYLLATKVEVKSKTYTPLKITSKMQQLMHDSLLVYYTE